MLVSAQQCTRLQRAKRTLFHGRTTGLGANRKLIPATIGVGLCPATPRRAPERWGKPLRAGRTGRTPRHEIRPNNKRISALADRGVGTARAPLKRLFCFCSSRTAAACQAGNQHRTAQRCCGPGSTVGKRSTRIANGSRSLNPLFRMPRNFSRPTPPKRRKSRGYVATCRRRDELSTDPAERFCRSGTIEPDTSFGRCDFAALPQATPLGYMSGK